MPPVGSDPAYWYSHVPYTYYPQVSASTYAMQYQQMYGPSPASTSYQQEYGRSRPIATQTYAPQQYTNATYGHTPQSAYTTPTIATLPPEHIAIWNQFVQSAPFPFPWNPGSMPPPPPKSVAGHLGLPPPPPPPPLPPTPNLDTQVAKPSRNGLVQKSNSQLNGKSKQATAGESLPKVVITSNVPSTPAAILSQQDVLGKRKRDMKQMVQDPTKSNVDCMKKPGPPNPVRVIGQLPTRAAVKDTPQENALRSSMPGPLVEKFATFRKSKDPRLLSFTNVDHLIIDRRKNTATKNDAASLYLPNIQDQPILVTWPSVEVTMLLETRPSPAHQLAIANQEETGKTSTALDLQVHHLGPIPISEASIGETTVLMATTETGVVAAASQKPVDSNQSSGQPTLRYPTSEEMQKLIRSIEDQQWEARAAASYDRPRKPDECFADSNWHPYRCFLCKQTRNTWKEMRNHVEVIHSVIMKDKIRAWECFYPACNQSFCDRSNGVQHAMAEHWRIPL
jgi:hypothetical protein